MVKEGTLSLKNKTFRGMAWNSIEKFAVQALSFLISTILARLLSPSDFGLIGMLAIFFAVSEIFVGSGFSSALIQKKNRTEKDFSTIFFYNFLVALLFYFLLFISAPLIAEFYNAESLVLLTRVLSLTLILNSLSLVQQTKLTINLDFKTQTIIALISLVGSGCLGVMMAYLGYGVWALVIQSLANASFRTILLFIFIRWKPQLLFDLNSFRELFGFSSKLLGAHLIATFFNNIYSVLIGRYFKTSDLGFYTRARLYPEYISTASTSVLQGVSFPVLASLQDDRQRMMSVYSRLMGIVTFTIIPTLSLFALLSEPFIRFFLTSKWLPVVTLMQWICFARIITPISTLNMNILNAIGRSDLFLKVDASKIPLMLLIFFITLPLGLKAVVIGHFINNFLCFFINAYYPWKLFNFGAWYQIKQMKITLITTSIMLFIVYLINSTITSDLSKLVVGIIVAMVSYLGINFIFKSKELFEVVSTIKPYFLKEKVA